MIPFWLHEQGEDHSDNRHTCSSGGFSKKRNPFAQANVTLHFDSDKNVTIGILNSRSCEMYEVYFRCRVEQGTAYERSPLYYELDGYVRENLTKIRLHNLNEADQVVVALGALELSDQSQRREMIEEELARSSRNNSNDAPSLQLQEAALEIACQWRLVDDLDFLSLYFMRKVNNAFRRVAQDMIERKMKTIQLAVTPYVDGYYTSGYSNFIRQDSSRLVRHSEQSRNVEFQQCPDVILGPTNVHSEYIPAKVEVADFAWNCEELALANLHRWWGDIVTRDYVGQKLVVRWKPRQEEGLPVDDVILLTVRLSTQPGVYSHSGKNAVASIKYRVFQSEIVQVDDVTTSYRGKASVLGVNVSFLDLVRRTSRMRVSMIERKFKDIERYRPLSDSESAYLAFFHRASNLRE